MMLVHLLRKVDSGDNRLYHKTEPAQLESQVGLADEWVRAIPSPLLYLAALASHFAFNTPTPVAGPAPLEATSLIEAIIDESSGR